MQAMPSWLMIVAAVGAVGLFALVGLVVLLARRGGRED
jgi:hypothetical protein